MSTRLQRRIEASLGYVSSPRSTAVGPVLLQILRDDLTEAGLSRLIEPAPPAEMTRKYVVSLYRAVRIVWLAELVFGHRDTARAWLGQPKCRLHGRAPLELARCAADAPVLERWLIAIDQGSGL